MEVLVLHVASIHTMVGLASLPLGDGESPDSPLGFLIFSSGERKGVSLLLGKWKSYLLTWFLLTLDGKGP